MHDEQGVRVDRVAAAGADLEVELGADHVAGGADGTEGADPPGGVRPPTGCPHTALAHRQIRSMPRADWRRNAAALVRADSGMVGRRAAGQQMSTSGRARDDLAISSR